MPRPKEHPAVEADIKEAARRYEDGRPGLGGQFIDAVRAGMRGAERNPLRYAIRFADIRRLRLVRFPYSVWFFLQGETIFVLAVLHDKRDHREILAGRRSQA